MIIRVKVKYKINAALFKAIILTKSLEKTCKIAMPGKKENSREFNISLPLSSWPNGFLIEFESAQIFF